MRDKYLLKSPLHFSRLEMVAAVLNHVITVFKETLFPGVEVVT